MQLKFGFSRHRQGVLVALALLATLALLSVHRASAGVLLVALCLYGGVLRSLLRDARRNRRGHLTLWQREDVWLVQLGVALYPAQLRRPPILLPWLAVVPLALQPNGTALTLWVFNDSLGRAQLSTLRRALRLQTPRAPLGSLSRLPG